MSRARTKNTHTHTYSRCTVKYRRKKPFALGSLLHARAVRFSALYYYCRTLLHRSIPDPARPKIPAMRSLHPSIHHRRTHIKKNRFATDFAFANPTGTKVAASKIRLNQEETRPHPSTKASTTRANDVDYSHHTRLDRRRHRSFRFYQWGQNAQLLRSLPIPSDLPTYSHLQAKRRRHLQHHQPKHKNAQDNNNQNQPPLTGSRSKNRFRPT